MISRQDCTTMDKLPLYVAKIHRLSFIDMDYKQSINFCLVVLQELGCNLVPSRTLLPIQAIASLLKPIQMAKKTSEESSRTLSTMTDSRQKAIITVLSKLAYACYLSDNDFVTVLCITRIIQMTHKHGVNDESGGGYASLGLMAKAILGDFVTAASFAEKALLLQQRAQTKYTAPTALFSAYNFVFSWTNPLQSCLNPFLEGFASGMRSGNIDFSMWCLLAHHVQMPYQMGKPLSLILSRCPDCVHQMEELRQQDHCLMLNLAGQSKETTRLKGELFACDEFVAKTPLQTAAVNLAKLELLVYYGDFDSAAKHAIKCSDSFDKTTNGMFLSMMETFHRGVALYAMARRTKKRKYRKRAIRVRSTIAKWVQNGNPNVKHYHSLLNAEQAALDREYHEAEALYKEAIILAARPGYLHDAALFNERYADFLRKEGHHFALAEDEIVYRIEEAIRYYKEWGAKAKVEMLQAEHGRLLH